MMSLIAVGLLFVVVLGLFMGIMMVGGVPEGRGKGWKWLLVIIIALAIGFAISGALHFEAKVNADVWNNGLCPTCEEHWIPNGVTKSKNGSVTKYYYCPECYCEITQ